MDAQVLIPIQAAQEAKLRSTGQLRLFEGMMLVLEDVLLPLQERGLKIDREKRESAKILYSRRASEASTLWAQLSGDTNPSSVPQLKELLYEHWGLEPQYTHDGKLTTDSEALRNLERTSPPEKAEAIGVLREYRRATKWHQTYTNIGDRIYPAYGPATKDRSAGGKRYGAIAATGRIIAKGDLSTKTPPLQQIPPDLRHLVVPEKGNLFIGADYKSQELRLIAAHTKCTWLLANMDECFNLIGDRCGCDRTRSKNLFYGLWAYGGSARAGQRALKAQGFEITIGECEDFIQWGHAVAGEIFEWHHRVLETADKGHLTNSFGRIRRFRDLKAQRNEALNYLVQSDGADMGWTILRPIEHQLAPLGGHLSIALHDGFYWEIPEENVDKAKVLIVEEMEHPFDNISPGFSCPVSVKVGSDWGAV
jgi:DNA polymerase-1